MADKRIDQLIAATEVGDNDLLVMEQSNTAKKVPGSVLKNYVYAAGADMIEQVQEAVADAQEAVNGIEAQKDTIAQSIASMVELGTDTTLSTTGMAADAKATGDKIKTVAPTIESMLAGREDTMVTTTNYVSGALVVANGTLYKLDANVASGETLVPSRNCHATTIDSELAAANYNISYLSNNKASTTDLSNLRTDLEESVAETNESVSDLKNAIDKDVLSIAVDQQNSFKEQAIGRANLGLNMRYGFKREKANSDCEGRITYLYDAIGLQPAGMTFDAETGEGSFNYGDWKGFVEAVARPVMLKNDGTVDYELDHEDQTKKLDGTASDVSNTAYAGNAMVEFGSALKWVKRYEDADYEYVIFSNTQLDDSYHAYAHTNDNGVVRDAFYLGMFQSIDVAGSAKLRSIGNGGKLYGGHYFDTQIASARNNGAGYNILYKSAWDYVSDLCTLISKTDDSKAAFGTGVDARKNEKLAAGQRKDQGAFAGSNDGLTTVKVFWLEDYWGNVWQGLAGAFLVNGTVYTRMTGPYCDTPRTAMDVSTYLNTGICPSGTSGNLTKVTSTTDEYGYLGVSNSGGAANAYIPDSLYFNASGERVCYVGAGYATAADRAGSRALNLTNAASASYAYDGSRLSYIPA